MDSNGKNAGAVTPVKDPQLNRSKISKTPKHSENANPNFASPDLKISKSPAGKSEKKIQKSAQKNPNAIVSPPLRSKIRQRKFVVAKKNSKREKPNLSGETCKCKISGNSEKCLCVAYESLRASQENFFKSRNGNEEDHCLEKNGLDDTEVTSETGSANMKRSRDKFLEEARENVPEPGSGRVMHLVQAFEKLLSIPKSKDLDEIEKDEKESECTKKGMKWELPGLQPKAPETQVSSSSFCPSDFFVTSESLGLKSRVCSPLDSSQGSFTASSRTSSGGRRSRRNSYESSGTFGGRHWKRRQLKATSQKPFKLRTEQRGRSKEEEFSKKVQKMMIEEEKQRIPLAQGLPWTTDEPECLAKPPVKESTRPFDLVLHSDVRAVERAEFDHQVAEKMSFVEQYRMERERLQKLAEEEEIKRLRQELVPRAQPMPYFDRPFIPRRSEKHPTIPKEPKFHIPQHKKIKSCMSWNEIYIHQH